jgi:uncharacterized protein
MLERIVGFVDRLRMVGVPVSTSEAIDASHALGLVDWTDRENFRSTLATTMVKSSAHRPAFDSLFDIYFPHAPGDALDDGAPEDKEQSQKQFPDDMTAELLDALMKMDLGQLDELAAEAIRRYASMEPGRPVGGRYYQWRVEQALRMNELGEALAQRLGAGAAGSAGAPGLAMQSRLAEEDAKGRIAELRRRIERLIRARLVAERGPEAMARAVVRPLPEEVEFLQASSDDLAEMRRTVAILARRLASRLAYKHHQTRRGRLDFRRTIRKSLETGGTPLVPKMRHRTHRPEIVMLCDVSGSVAAFSRFALALLYTMSQHFRKVRSFAFVDTIDEVTQFFTQTDFTDALRRIREEAEVVWMDGHSDYGHSFREFIKRYPDAMTPRTTVLLLGDCRSNFRGPEAAVLHEIRSRSRKLYLLNPEPHRHWDTGDSIVRAYEQACDGVHECRNLRQLAEFIERIA